MGWRYRIGICIGVSGSNAADSWPVRPIRLIVPFGPGGATDIVSRLLQPSLNETLGQQLVVDNRPGAYGNIAAELAARAAPDGYTIFIANVSVASINPTLFAGRLKVDIPKELSGVTLLASIPDVMVARSDFPAQGGGQAVAGILSGEVHYSFLNAASVFPHVQSGRMKALATTAQKRLPEYPNTPTMAEAGYPGVGGENWNGFFVPARTPRPIVDRLYAATAEAANRAQVKSAFAKASVPMVISSSPEEFRGFVDGQLKRWQRIIKENNVKID